MVQFLLELLGSLIKKLIVSLFFGLSSGLTAVFQHQDHQHPKKKKATGKKHRKK